ncbi:hypothetical protein OJ253_3244 [Cryptosporidium canis]|uniref:Uncharacterized protein n=1 Tax=Cryptosporidium canis TaxID=195482 RepID=A0A9D5DJ23_9CRYT|nr:hypothetical protein OJ253_3244 [Cryptosporidium canis]
MRLLLVVWLFTQIASVESTGPDGEQGGELIFHKVEGGWLGVQAFSSSVIVLSVGVGSVADPEELPGLSNLVQESLCLGTSRFFDGSNFCSFIAAETECPHRLVDQRGQRDFGDQSTGAREEFPQTAVQLQHYDSGGGQRGAADQALRRGDLLLLPGQEPQDLAYASVGLGQNHSSSPSWGGRERHPHEDQLDE